MHQPALFISCSACPSLKLRLFIFNAISIVSRSVWDGCKGTYALLKYLSGHDPGPSTKQPVHFIICYGPGEGVTLHYLKHRDMSHTTLSNNLFNKVFNEANLSIHRVTQYSSQCRSTDCMS